MPMPTKNPDDDQAKDEIKQGLYHYASQWGESSLPPTLTATLIAAQSLRPFRALPMIFPPIFLFSSYLGINGFSKDAAGLTSAWSAAYLILARRRSAGGLRQKFGTRGVVRGATMALCLTNVVCGGLVYALSGKRPDVEER